MLNPCSHCVYMCMYRFEYFVVEFGMLLFLLSIFFLFLAPSLTLCMFARNQSTRLIMQFDDFGFNSCALYYGIVYFLRVFFLHTLDFIWLENVWSRILPAVIRLW